MPVAPTAAFRRTPPIRVACFGSMLPVRRSVGEWPLFAQSGLPLRSRRRMTSRVWSIWPDIETGMIGAAAPSPRSAGWTGDRRCAVDADQADCHRSLDRLNRLRRVADRPLASETYRALDGARGSGKAERAAGLKIEERRWRPVLLTSRWEHRRPISGFWRRTAGLMRSKTSPAERER